MKDFTKIATHMPLLPLKKHVVFPQAEHELLVPENAALPVIEHFGSVEHYALAMCVDNDFNYSSTIGIPLCGTLIHVESFKKAAKGYSMRIKGIERISISDLKFNQGYTAQYQIIHDTVDIDEQTQHALLQNIKTLSIEILAMIDPSQEMKKFVENITDLRMLMSLVATRVAIPFKEKQKLLEIVSIKNQGLKILELLSHQKESIKVQIEMSKKVNDSTSKLQREAILREQLKAIKGELNNGSSGKKKNLRERLEEVDFPEEVREAVFEELERLETMSENSPEYGMIRTYIELVLALPWSKEEYSQPDLKTAKTVLDEDHYGLKKIKERILQHLAVLQLKKNKRGSILMFVGPPGVGKTSLGKSIARALGRKFIRASLGGIRDEAEIRGHRRTYIGSMPGRIIQGIKKAGVTNPVFLLDEIDKLMSGGWSGDPASALLEVLDPEQNNTFRDHYLDVPYDLSDVFFIATANSLETVPAPLRDRMEIISLSGYTENEKFHIAERHLIPKQREDHGIKSEQLEIKKNAVQEIISSYTRESGVRDLQRKIGAVCRVSASKIIESDDPVTVKKNDLIKILGKPVFSHEQLEAAFPPGVVTGLAWTPVGGEILFIETSAMPGKGDFTLTGQLGDVMKESARIALSLVRGRIPVTVPHFDFSEEDIHIHVPSGSIQKDGPSAGIAILTSITSMVMGKKVNPKMAMTGEITLRGAVMPVGGVKEKLLAAYQAGVKEIIFSEKNMKDLDDIPVEIRKKLKIHPVKNVEEVIKIALGIDFVPSYDHGQNHGEAEDSGSVSINQ